MSFWVCEDLTRIFRAPVAALLLGNERLGDNVDDEDFRALIALVQAELRNSGAADVANDRHYLIEDLETGELRLLPLQKHLIALLEAFGRHMAVRDHATYRSAVAGINRRLSGKTRVAGAVVVPAPGETARDEIDLSRAPDLGNLRDALLQLIGNLGETPAPRSLG